MSAAIEGIPLIDISNYSVGLSQRREIALQLSEACQSFGFFYLSGHGVSIQLQKELEQLSHDFFALKHHQKMEIEMARAGKAWRGYFPVGAELTSGTADLKEGLYFGQEHGHEHPHVMAGTALFGANLFPAKLPALKPVVLEYMSALESLGHKLMALLSLGLGLDEDYFYHNYTQDPTLLFRIFHYPCEPAADPLAWGVGEHSDYGVLTILRQDAVGGLEIKSQGCWRPAPAVENTFVCNLGDMLEKMSGGIYRSTPHRVRRSLQSSRFSWPFFFDPGFDVQISAIDLPQLHPPFQQQPRWDGLDIHAWGGSYGDYLISKVSKVFPFLI